MMRKFLASILIASCLICMLAGCDSHSNGGDSTSGTELQDTLPEFTPTPTLEPYADGIVGEFDDYKITCINNQFYINFTDGNDYVPPEIGCGALFNFTSFPSFNEMVTQFLNGTMDKVYQNEVKRVLSEDEHGLKLWNLYRLYIPTLQKTWTITSGKLGDTFYSVSLKSATGATLEGEVELYYSSSEGTLSGMLESKRLGFEHDKSEEGGTLLEHTNANGKESFIFENDTGKYRNVHYEMEWGDKQFVIYETYCLDDFQDKKRESDVAPSYMIILVQENGHYYWVECRYLSRALSPNDIVELTKLELFTP